MASPVQPRVILLANLDKAAVAEALVELRPWLERRAQIVAEPDSRSLTRISAAHLPEADLAIVLGGDGTLLAQARQLVDRDVPLLGVNFGKLGFLAEFSIEGLKEHWPAIAEGECLISRRLMMHVAVFGPDAPDCGSDPRSMPVPIFESLALNDAVITAGAPFRMIELALAIDPAIMRSSATAMSADGVIIATPSGSTAYNLAAGGPIVSPEVDAFCVTPLCPHTLAMRPLIVSAGSHICVRVIRANEGTTLVIDGQVSTPIAAGRQLLITRHPLRLKIVQNPELNYWKMLARKMGWAARPRSR
jgi:NAD+ kinase